MTQIRFSHAEISAWWHLYKPLWNAPVLFSRPATGETCATPLGLIVRGAVTARPSPYTEMRQLMISISALSEGRSTELDLTQVLHLILPARALNAARWYLERPDFTEARYQEIPNRPAVFETKADLLSAVAAAQAKLQESVEPRQWAEIVAKPVLREQLSLRAAS